MGTNMRPIGDNEPAFIVAELGINHNGEVGVAKQMIDVAKECGVDAVKFQKRTIDMVYSKEELEKPRETPFGKTNGDLKRKLEFSIEDYQAIDAHCKERGIAWFASCWDEVAVDDIDQFDPPCFKVASASLTDENLLRYTAGTGKPIMLSTGMSRLEDMDRAVEIINECGVPLVVMHCVATYPSLNEDLNLRYIPELRKRYLKPIGYSGHEQGIATSVASVVLGACVVERHFTLNRAWYGSDQSASLEPRGLGRLVRDIRAVESAMGSGVKQLLPGEIAIANKLRRVGWPTTNQPLPA